MSEKARRRVRTPFVRLAGWLPIALLARSDAPSGPVCRDMSRAFVSLGSNLGDRGAHLRRALDALRRPAAFVARCVADLRDRSGGPPPQGPYLNAVAEIETGLEPRALLERLLQIEAEEGRVRGGARGEARTLDLDLLLFADRCIDEESWSFPIRACTSGASCSSRSASWRRSGCIRVRVGRSRSSRHACVIRRPCVPGRNGGVDQAAVVVVEQRGEEDQGGPAIRSRGVRVAASAVAADDPCGVLEADACDLVGSPGGVENGLGDRVGKIAALDCEHSRISSPVTSLLTERVSWVGPPAWSAA